MDIEWLKGQICTRVYEHLPGAGVFTFQFTSATVAIDCAWRLVRGGRVTLAHNDHQQLFGLREPVDICRDAVALLAAHPITGGRINSALGDMVLEFEGAILLVS
jgi:hypothetical protein